MSDNELTAEERIQQQTRGNLQFSFASSLGYLKEKGDSLEKFARYVADKARPGWEGVETPEQFCNAMALNMESFGSKIITKEGDENKSKLTYTDFMPENVLETFKLSPDDMDSLNFFSHQMAIKLGFKLEWTRDGENTTLSVTK